jgi:hypothetical protein
MQASHSPNQIGFGPARPMLLAEARMAVHYLERAEDWAADVDEGIVADLSQIHRRLLEKIDGMWGADRRDH